MTPSLESEFVPLRSVLSPIRAFIDSVNWIFDSGGDEPDVAGEP